MHTSSDFRDEGRIQIDFVLFVLAEKIGRYFNGSGEAASDAYACSRTIRGSGVVSRRRLYRSSQA